jgi:hypothetical protein
LPGAEQLLDDFAYFGADKARGGTNYLGFDADVG